MTETPQAEMDEAVPVKSKQVFHVQEEAHPLKTLVQKSEEME